MPKTSGLSRRKGAANSGQKGRFILCVIGIVFAAALVGTITGLVTMFLRDDNATAINSRSSSSVLRGASDKGQEHHNRLPKNHDIPQILQRSVEVSEEQEEINFEKDAIQSTKKQEVPIDDGPLKDSADPRNLPRDDDFEEADDSNDNIDKDDDNTKEEEEQINDNASVKQEVLVLTTSLGPIRIDLRPDYSPESVDYIRKVVNQDETTTALRSPSTSTLCDRCNFYRAESKGILQGMITSRTVPVPTVKGRCPPGLEHTIRNDCPAWDKQCGCHGPVMERGFVGWAAGKLGPDFFIDDYRRPAKWWGTQHTVWGQITDEASLETLQQVWDLPVDPRGGLTYLQQNLRFSLHIEMVSRTMAAR